MKRIFPVVIATILCVCSGCDFVCQIAGRAFLELERCFPDRPPYTVMSLSCEAQSATQSFSVAGVCFSLCNNAKAQVESFQVSFTVWDASGKANPLYADNHIHGTCVGSIAPGMAETFEISLDAYLLAVPKERLTVGAFVVTRIDYADGSVWENRAELYGVEG